MTALSWVVVFFGTGAALVAGFLPGALWFTVGVSTVVVGLAANNYRRNREEAAPFILLHAVIAAMILFSVAAFGEEPHPIAAAIGVALLALTAALFFWPAPKPKVAESSSKVRDRQAPASPRR